MTDKDLKKLKRDDFIEIIYEYQHREQALMEENRQLRQQLEERGSIAQAAQSLNQALEEAQNAAGQYLQELDNLRRRAEGLPLEKVSLPKVNVAAPEQPVPEEAPVMEEPQTCEQMPVSPQTPAHAEAAAYEDRGAAAAEPVQEQNAESVGFRPDFDLDILSWDPYEDSGMGELPQEPEVQQPEPEIPQPTGPAAILDDRWLLTAPQANPQKMAKASDGMAGDYRRLMDRLRRK